MKRVFSLLFCAAALLNFAACSDNDDLDTDVTTPDTDGDTDADADTDNDEATISDYLYTLNGGSYQSNNSSLSSYNVDTESSVDCIFSTVNGQGLGDTAQDIMLFEDEIYITLYGSRVIFVTDLKGTIITEIRDAADRYQLPRYLVTDGEYIYVSYYDGGVAKIDPATYEIVASADVGINPDQLVEVDGNLYITISQGYGNYNDCNTIDVYDTATLTYTKSIEVILNPISITADDNGNLYVLSMGNYGYGDPAIYTTLQKIDTEGTVSIIDVTYIEDATPSLIAMGADDKLYVVEGVSNASTGWTMVGDIYAYDTVTGDITTFITDGTSIPNMYSLSYDMESGELYVGTSDYINTGDVYVYNADGTLKTTFGVGLNPVKSIAVSIEE